MCLALCAIKRGCEGTLLLASIRVVVTGMGTISSVGMGRQQFWQGIVEGKSGIKQLTRVLPHLRCACKIAAEITDFDPLQHGIDAKQAKRMDRFIQFAVAANNMAISRRTLGFDQGRAYPYGHRSWFCRRRIRDHRKTAQYSSGEGT